MTNWFSVGWIQTKNETELAKIVSDGKSYFLVLRDGTAARFITFNSIEEVINHYLEHFGLPDIDYQVEFKENGSWCKRDIRKGVIKNVDYKE